MEMDAMSEAGSIRLNDPIPLELLAPEILLLIITSLPGLDTLWNLMRASPHIWRLFDSYALFITECILSGPNSILPLAVSELVRGVVLVRSRILPFQSLGEFQLQFMQGQIPNRNSQSFISLGPGVLSTATLSVATLRSVIATAYHISALAQACLESCLVRIRDPSFKPKHACDPTPNYYSRYYIENGCEASEVLPEDRKFVGTLVKIVDAGDPSWIEEMRALRAMWIIQLTGEVQHLVEDPEATLGWSTEDIKTLSSMDPTSLIDNSHAFSINIEEMKTAISYIRTLGDATKTKYYRLPQAPSATVSARRTTTSLKPNRDTTYVYGFYLKNEAHPLRKGSFIPKDGRPIINDAYEWGQTESSLLRVSPGMKKFRYLTCGRSVMVSPLSGIKFDSFRPLGLAFWDQWRMYLLGLTHGVSEEWMLNGKRYPPYFYHFAMESILPPQEVISVKAALREQRRQPREERLR